MTCIFVPFSRVQFEKVSQSVWIFADVRNIQEIHPSQIFRISESSAKIRLNFFLNLSNVLNILLTSLFLQKMQIFERFELANLWIFFTFAKDSDIQKIRLKYFLNLSNVLNILLTSLFLEKIQIFERFELANLLNICHICKRFRHSKDTTQIFPESFESFEYPANFILFAKYSDIQKIQICWIASLFWKI